jgi:hypothetical protein
MCGESIKGSLELTKTDISRIGFTGAAAFGGIQIHYFQSRSAKSCTAKLDHGTLAGTNSGKGYTRGVKLENEVGCWALEGVFAQSDRLSGVFQAIKIRFRACTLETYHSTENAM